MKTLFAVCIYFLLATISPAAESITAVYDDGTLLTEDVTWSGDVLVHGAVTVAPQATLRIAPGTTVRFAATAASNFPTLLIQGRLHAAGTAERPILLTAVRSKQTQGSWGGIVFLSTEKRNLLEQCRIEYADVGIDLRFSSITMKGVTVVRARTALLSHDGVIQTSSCSVSDSETGIEIHDSEFEGRDLTVDSCQRGFVASRSALVLFSPKIVNNKQAGVEADECRVKITGGDFSDNALGVRIKSGEGQISMSRFQRNSLTALLLHGARIKIQRCLFADNRQDALQTNDGRSLIVNNAFRSNGGYNLYNAGVEAVSARQNWWGTVEQAQILQKIYDAPRDNRNGKVDLFPWLTEKPQSLP